MKKIYVAGKLINIPGCIMPRGPIGGGGGGRLGGIPIGGGGSIGGGPDELKLK